MTDTFSTHNVGELTPVSQGRLKRLSRFPSRFETAYLLPRGKSMARESVGCELRFVSKSDRIRVRLESPGGAEICIYQGDFLQSQHTLESGRAVELTLEPRPTLFEIPDSVQQDLLFGPDVFRIQVKSGVLYLDEIDGYGLPVEAPSPKSCPKVKWLAWGSSITHRNTLGYVHQAAQRLRVDVQNKGMGGACGVEPFLAAYFAEECDWDFMTAEWGINVRGDVDADEFASRVKGCLDHLIPTGKPLFLITLFPNGSHLNIGDPLPRDRQTAFEDILRKAADEAPDHVYLIEGSKVLTHYDYLSADLVHPTDIGHSVMGENLAKLLRPHLEHLLKA